MQVQVTLHCHPLSDYPSVSPQSCLPSSCVPWCHPLSGHTCVSPQSCLPSSCVQLQIGHDQVQVVGVVDDGVTVHMVHIHRESFLAGQYLSIYIHDYYRTGIYTHTEMHIPCLHLYKYNQVVDLPLARHVCVCVACMCMCVLVYVWVSAGANVYMVW